MRTCRLKEIIAKLNQILTGYYHYYGITDNTESITAFRYNIMRSLFYCLNRRSQKKSYNWVEFLNMLDNSYPLVRPRIYVSVYNWFVSQRAGCGKAARPELCEGCTTVRGAPTRPMNPSEEWILENRNEYAGRPYVRSGFYVTENYCVMPTAEKSEK